MCRAPKHNGSKRWSSLMCIIAQRRLLDIIPPKSLLRTLQMASLDQRLYRKLGILPTDSAICHLYACVCVQACVHVFITLQCVEVKRKVLHMLSEHSSTELYPQPSSWLKPLQALGLMVELWPYQLTLGLELFFLPSWYCLPLSSWRTRQPKGISKGKTSCFTFPKFSLFPIQKCKKMEKKRVSLPPLPQDNTQVISRGF